MANLRISLQQWALAGTVLLLDFVTLLRTASAQNTYADCTLSPTNCAEYRRWNCDVSAGVPNVCGACKPGNFGGNVPMNTHCLSNASCALVYSDQKGCPGDTSSSPRLPFIVPMQRCVCDVNGDYWPTAPGSCAKLKVTMPDGSSLFTLLRCSTTACEDSSCVELMSWAPQEYPFT